MPHQPANSPLGAFLAALREEKIPCILIGNMAAIHQGALLMTVDYDFCGVTASAAGLPTTRRCSRSAEIEQKTIDDGREGFGLQFNGSTSVDRVNYFETLAGTGANLDFAISLEADRLMHSFIKNISPTTSS